MDDEQLIWEDVFADLLSDVQVPRHAGLSTLERPALYRASVRLTYVPSETEDRWPESDEQYIEAIWRHQYSGEGRGYSFEGELSRAACLFAGIATGEALAMYAVGEITRAELDECSQRLPLFIRDTQVHLIKAYGEIAGDPPPLPLPAPPLYGSHLPPDVIQVFEALEPEAVAHARRITAGENPSALEWTHDRSLFSEWGRWFNARQRRRAWELERHGKIPPELKPGVPPDSATP